MSVLDRSELEASPLADLHAIADQVGLDGFRRMRKADLIDAILSQNGGEDAAPAAPAGEAAEDAAEPDEDGGEDAAEAPRSRSRRGRGRRGAERGESEPAERGGRSGRGGGRGRGRGEDREQESGAGRERGEERSVEGVVELLGNGSAFLRVDPPEPSDDDVYISAAQVRRCELVSGDKVAGPVRPPRRSERYPSLVRVDTINGAPAESVSEGTHYEDLAAAWPTERLALGGDDPTLKAIEWLTPIGKGSRVVIAGPSQAGKTEALRRVAGALAGQEGLELTLVLAGARPEEISEWQAGPLAPVAALSFAASADALGQAVERAVDTARRVAARGADAIVLIDSLDGLHPPAARKVLAAARNIADGGSLTVIATAGRPLGGETTVISLDPKLATTGRLPALDLGRSGTLRPELLVGEPGAQAIREARTEALEH